MQVKIFSSTHPDNVEREVNAFLDTIRMGHEVVDIKLATANIGEGETVTQLTVIYKSMGFSAPCSEIECEVIKVKEDADV